MMKYAPVNSFKFVYIPPTINFGHHIAKSRVANKTILPRAKAKVHAAPKQGREWEIFFNKTHAIYDILIKTGWIHREEECR